MEKDLKVGVLSKYLKEFFKMIDMGMHATIGEEAHEVNTFGACSGLGNQLIESF
jgi:hypothetical protein